MYNNLQIVTCVLFVISVKSSLILISYSLLLQDLKLVAVVERPPGLRELSLSPHHWT